MGISIRKVSKTVHLEWKKKKRKEISKRKVKKEKKKEELFLNLK